MRIISYLPTANALLNATCAFLLVVGYLLIRRQRIRAHTFCMGLAFLVSIVFLTSYLVYHYFHGRTPFPGTGWVRPVYFSILVSHTVLAVVIVPLALRTLYLAARSRFEEHKGIARWTLPLWLYVSVTGVIVYLMLYQVDWAHACPGCGEALSRSDPKTLGLAQGWRRSIAFMMATPYLLFAGVTALVIRAARRKGSGR